VKIVVLLRRLRQAAAPKTGGPLGACETAALRAAVALRAGRPGATLAAISAGPIEEDHALAAAAAASARTIRVWHPAIEGADYAAYARVLASTCRHIDFDLILCGARSSEEGLGAIGPATAEHLSIPHITAVTALSWNGGKLLFHRRYRGKTSWLGGRPPLLVTVAAECLVPKPVKPRKTPPPHAEPPQVLDLEDIGLLPQELSHRRDLEGALAPCVSRKPELFKNAKALVKTLRERGLL
jgi:electron transfer flavoprotein beta subunit